MSRALLLLLPLSLAACTRDARTRRAIEAAVRAELRQPETAEFVALQPNRDDPTLYCGTVKAADDFGATVSTLRYAARPRGDGSVTLAFAANWSALDSADERKAMLLTCGVDRAP